MKDIVGGIGIIIEEFGDTWGLKQQDRGDFKTTMARRIGRHTPNT